MSENIERTDLPEVSEKKPFLKRLPVMSLPAIIALILMVIVFLQALFTSFHRFQLLKPNFIGPYLGGKYYDNFINSGSFGKSLGDSLACNGLILLICGALSALLCLLYRAFKKPGAVLTLACLWLIPVCLPTALMSQGTRSLLHFMGPLSAFSVYLYALGLQTIGMFCFSGGIFAYLNFRKKGEIGKAPFMGLLAAVLVFLLRSLTANGLYYGFETLLTRTFERASMPDFFSGLSGIDVFQANAVAVLKIAMQILIGLIPVFFLCRLSKERAIGEKTPKALWCLFPAALAGILLSLFAGCHGGESYAYFGTVSINSLIVTLAGGAFGGLIAWSFIHLMKRTSAVRFGIIALVLSCALSCIGMIYILIRYRITTNELLPQVLLSAFDWRVILLVITLAFMLRSHKEIHTGYLVLALCLLIAAFSWGELSNQVVIFNKKTSTIPIFYYQLTSSVDTRPSILLQIKLLMVVPPLALGLGSALLMRKAFQKAEPRDGSSVPLSEPETHSEIQA